MSTLDDLIVRSRDLNSEINAVRTNATTNGGASAAPILHTLPRIDRDLTQVMDAGRRLWESLGSPTEFSESDRVKAALVMNKTDTNFALPSKSPKLQKLLKNADLAPLEPCRDLDQLLTNERENAILALIENSEKTADNLAFENTTQTILSKWNREKIQLMQHFTGISANGDSWRETSRVEAKSSFFNANSFFNTSSGGLANLSFKEGCGLDRTRNNRFTSLAAMNSLEKTFAGILKENVVGDLLASIMAERERLQTISRRMNNIIVNDDETFHNIEDIMELWDLLNHVLSRKLTHKTQKDKAIHGASIDYLETRFRRHVENVVKSNQHVMQRNKSLPTTLELVRAYAAIDEKRGLIQPNDLQYAHVYYCLRMGDIDAALEVSDDLLSQAIAQWRSNSLNAATEMNSFVQKSGQRVDQAMERQLLMQYKRVAMNQPYFGAVLAALGCANVHDDHGQVANNSECWLWLKLLQIESLSEVTASSTTRQSYVDFKRSLIQSTDGQLLSDSFASKPLIYVKMLLLSQQWEQGLDILTRMGDACAKIHSPHVALVLNHHSLLAKNSQVWNFGRAIVNYCAPWQAQCAEFAIHYFYNLNDLPDTASMGVYNAQSTLFHECISRMIFEGVNDQTFEQMFNRNSGEIYKLLSIAEAHILFAKVAKDCERHGRLEQAVRLYEIATEYGDCVDLLIEGMANGKSSLLQLAQDFIERVGGDVLQQQVDNADTLFLVMDMTNLMSKLGSAEKMPIQQSKMLDITSYEIVNAINVIPLTISAVEGCAESFRTKPETVRAAFPMMLVAIMKLYVRLSTTTPDEKARLKEAANALVMFSGRVKYRTSASVNAQLVHLQLSV